MSKVVVTGAAGWVGRALCARLLERDFEVRAIDRRRMSGFPDEVETINGDLLDIDIKTAIEGADVVVHLAWDAGVDGGVIGAPQSNLEAIDALTDAAGAVGVKQLVFMSCAVVYGAWPDNPIPLRETAPVNPNVSYSFAVQKAEAESRVREWAVYNGETVLTIMRPVVIVAGQTDSPLARVLGGHRALREPGQDHQVQFVHLDDVVSAINHVVDKRLAGTFNVAPDKWIFERQARELVGTSSDVRIPSKLLRSARAFRFFLGRPEDSPSVDPYVENAWVVANDSLRATGWSPKYSNEEALVSWQPLTWWGKKTPSQRRMLIVGSASTAATGALAGAGLLTRRLLRRR